MVHEKSHCSAYYDCSGSRSSMLIHSFITCFELTVPSQAAKEKAAHEKEYSQRQISMSRGGSRRGGDRSDQPPVNPDGWAVAGSAARPAKVDLSNFGKISNKQTPPTFGPGSIFTSKKDKRESISRTSSSSNMFSMLLNAESGADKSIYSFWKFRNVILISLL